MKAARKSLLVLPLQKSSKYLPIIHLERREPPLGATVSPTSCASGKPTIGDFIRSQKALRNRYKRH